MQHGADRGEVYVANGLGRVGFQARVFQRMMSGRVIRRASAWPRKAARSFMTGRQRRSATLPFPEAWISRM